MKSLNQYRYGWAPLFTVMAVAGVALWSSGCLKKSKQASVFETLGMSYEIEYDTLSETYGDNMPVESADTSPEPEEAYGVLPEESDSSYEEMYAALSEAPDTPSVAYGALSDERDGKEYKTVEIGGQVWMAENLNYAPKSGGGWCYMDDEDFCGQYGRLYDWAAARAACPAGWHLPAALEWDELTGWVNFAAGGHAAAKMLAAADGWNKDRGNLADAEDGYGFSAMPGGLRNPDGEFINAGYHGVWWTATEDDGNRAYDRAVVYDEDTVTANSRHKKSGYSVRCVMDESLGAAYTLTLKASAGGTAAAYPRKASYNAGKRVTVTATPKSGYAFDKWTGGKVAGSPTAVVAMNSNMAITANFRPIAYGMLSDPRDGLTYKTVKMPDGLTWMAENLNHAPSKGKSWVYEYNTAYSDKYGRLYDWKTAMAVCPDGWRLPARREWDNLSKAVGGKLKRDGDGKVNWRGAGRSLKAASGWGENRRKHNSAGNYNGTDDYGFSALPGGYLCGVDCYGGGYDGAGYDGAWWTATASAATKHGVEQAYFRRVSFQSAGIDEDDGPKSNGYSVRCVAGADRFVPAAAPSAYSLTARAADGGTVSVSPAKKAYTAGETVSISAFPKCGFVFVKWADGETADAASVATTVTVNSNMTVTAEFTRVTPHVARGAFTDARDGETYKAVQICKQVWMAENLNHKTGGGRCYGDDDSNCKKYGRLYDWETAKKACPAGWHLATDKEWEALEGYADGWEKEISQWGVGGNRLKAKSGWKKYREKEGGGGTDDFGFSALPGGGYGPEGYFLAGEAGGWWTSTEAGGDGYAGCCRSGTEHKNAVVRHIAYNSNSVRADVSEKGDGFSARCVNDKAGRVPPPAALKLALNAGTGGTVSANPNKASYAAGERVTISAVPDRGYVFAKWTGSKVADAGYAVTGVIMAPNMEITANFNKSKAPPVAYGSLTDARDGKKYETVPLGGKLWMAENLNYQTPEDSWCYGDSDANCGKYGRLYDWNAAKTACPAGWRLPTVREWDALVKAAGGEKKAGAKLKAASGWTFFGSGWVRTGNGTDYYGFSALPGGYRSGGGFDYIGQSGYWWTATEDEDDAGEAHCRKMEEGDASVKGWPCENRKSNGLSVRCVDDDDASAVAAVKADSNVAAAADFNKGKTPPAAYGAPLTDARDGNSYKTVKIGGKTWMAENLNYLSGENSWCYENKTDRCKKYGRLYTWPEARKACPAGWHLPSRQEWNELANEAGGEKAAAQKLKSVSGWSRAGNGADDFGFAALPGGCRHYQGLSPDRAEFWEIGSNGYWWTATPEEFRGGDGAYGRGMASDSANFFEGNYWSSAGNSVRCVMDEDGAVTVTASIGGSASAAPRKALYKAGEEITITAAPNSGYAFAGWTGGVVANPDAETTAAVVNANMALVANFRNLFPTALTDKRDGKTYKTVKIGRKRWMAENLNYNPPKGGSWCYEDDPSYCGKYGRLYSWETAKKACPAGWRLPSRADWDSLAVTAGGWHYVGSGSYYEVGRKLKSKAKDGWKLWDQHEANTDNFGFSALPGGCRNRSSDGDDKKYVYFGAERNGYWWSSAKGNRGGAYYRELDYITSDVFGESDGEKDDGYSVRCVTDK